MSDEERGKPIAYFKDGKVISIETGEELKTPPLPFYHATTPEAAASIVANGFRDGCGTYGFVGLEEPIRGVFLSRSPCNPNDGAKGMTVLEVVLDLTEKELEPYGIVEWDDDEDEAEAVAYEWVMPAEVINTRGKVRLLSDDEALALD
jgi:hypothetical protein